MAGSGLLVAGLLAAGHIVARASGATRLAAVSKALPILVLAALVAAAPAVDATRYRGLVAAALVASAAGDVWLLFRRGFVPGLASFLVAHLLYLAAFVPDARVAAAPRAPLAFALAAAAGLMGLWPHLGRVRWAVLVYVCVIAAMGASAALRAAAPQVPTTSGTLALAGAVLFMLSDGLLAVRRFLRPFAQADTAVMTTYYAAQALIACSVVV